MGSTWGNAIKISIFGESHGTGIGVVIDGFPSGVAYDEAFVLREMERRAPGRNKQSTARKEPDRPEIQSGIFNGKTTGTPICAVIRNTNQRSNDYAELAAQPRPGHADYTGMLRYDSCNDPRGGGHFSGRLTAPLVFAGALCKLWLKEQGVTVGSHIQSIAQIQDMPFDDVEVTAEQLDALRNAEYPVNNPRALEAMLAAIEEFKRNPSIQFAYEYRSAEDNPERNINRVVSNTKPSPKSTSIHTGDARRVGTSNPGRSKSAQKKKKKASKGFSLLPIFFGMAVAFVIGAAILIYLIFTNSSNLLFSNRADVQVISFVGMTKDEFLATDYNNLLRAEFPEEYSSEPAGTIIRQTPKAGRTVKEKQRIVLTVSLGTQYVTIPETKNMVAEDAEQTLKDMGLRVTKKPMSDNSVANGAVVYTQPAAGETVEGDSTVILYVSRSEVSKESQVPSLTGKTIEEARNEVKGLNLSIRTIEQASEQPAGTVLSQSPDAGSTVRKSSVITLVVSTGVPEVVATPEPVEPTVNEDGTITVQESWWPSADGSHQIHQLTDGTMWNENGQRCDAQGNPIA